MRSSRLCALLLLPIAVMGCRRESPDSDRFSVEPAKTADAAAGTAPLFTIDLRSSSPRLSGLSSHRVQVDDPVYERSKTYDGLRLADIIDLFAPGGTRLPDDAFLVFVCLDGYRAPLAMRLARNGGILATREPGAAAEWEPLPAGSPVRSPAPYYLVWEPAAVSTGAHLPWPYGVIAIEAWTSDPLDRAKPVSSATQVVEGFDVFTRRCISCHRINGAGGTMAAELNIPVNVTEYWNPAALRQFVVDPRSIRAEAKMPKIADLTPQDVDRVIAYLDDMKFRKLLLEQ
jgi:mono/diheme cytochrome c family protein